MCTPFDKIYQFPGNRESIVDIEVFVRFTSMSSSSSLPLEALQITFFLARSYVQLSHYLLKLDLCMIIHVRLQLVFNFACDGDAIFWKLSRRQRAAKIACVATL